MNTIFRSRLTSWGLACAALVGLAVPGVLVAAAVPASAAAYCGQTDSDKDGSSWPRQTAGVSANMRSGSSTDCRVVGWADNRDVLDYHCFTWGAGGSWTYLRNDTDGTSGWVKDSLLPGNGSSEWCGH